MRATNLDYALMLARMGFKVIPCCWPGPTGKCACPRRHGGTPKKDRDIGKAPLTKHGLNDATADPTVIKRWWSTWPLANIGIDLTGHIMVDPDSDAAQIEAEELGLPSTLKRISNFDAYLYRAPEGLPATRLIQRGESGAIDVLAGGYMVAFGVHRTGCKVELQDIDVEPSTAPSWAVKWITEDADRKGEESKAMESARNESDSQPPVRLRATAMAWWSGTKFKDSPEGIDRSTTLYMIGLFLAEANASATVIANALAERDVTLGYEKYFGRQDASPRYAEIALKAIAAQDRPDEPRNRGKSGHIFRPLPAFTVTVKP